MIELLLGDFLPYIIGAVVALAGIWGYGKKREGDGRKKVVDEIEKADRKEAAGIREKLNEVARDGDALERLRRQGRLRD